MPFKRGTIEIGAVLRGSTVISKIYRGTTVIYELADGTWLELIEEIEVVGSAVTSVQFSGFTATKTDTLILVSDVNNTSGSGSSCYSYVNNNQTNTNYYHQLLQVDGTGVSAARGNNIEFMAVSAGTKSFNTTSIKLTNDGYFTVQGETTRKYGGSGVLLTNDYCSSTFTMASITQLDLVASASNAIGIGSRFQLYKISEGA